MTGGATGSVLGLVIEVLVAVLLVMTLIYCWRLNQRLIRLRADEQALRATIAELVTATQIAERAIAGLRSAVGEADGRLGPKLAEAARVSTDLSIRLGDGEDILKRIARIIEATRQGGRAIQPDAGLDRLGAPAAGDPGAQAMPGPLTMDAQAMAAAAAALAKRARMRHQGAI